MMKRAIALLLALLLAGAASAETREAVVWLEGEPEPVVETRYSGDLGFSFWYDAERLTVDEDMSEGGGSLIVFPESVDLPVYLEIMTPEAAGMLPWKFLEANAPAGVEYVEDVAESGAEIRWFSVAAEGGILQSFYAVDGSESFVVAVGTWPMEADEGWGARFRALLRTIAFDSDDPVIVRWWADADDDDHETLDIDAPEDAVGVVLTATRPLRDFNVLALEFEGVDDDGHVTFSEETLAKLDALEPGRQILVPMAFYGDIPNNGIRFTDPETGFTYRYAVAISGEDGSLILTPF